MDPIAKFCHGREGDTSMGVLYDTSVLGGVHGRCVAFDLYSSIRTLGRFSGPHVIYWYHSVQGAWITALARWIVWNVIMIPGLGL